MNLDIQMYVIEKKQRQNKKNSDQILTQQPKKKKHQQQKIKNKHKQKSNLRKIERQRYNNYSFTPFLYTIFVLNN